MTDFTRQTVFVTGGARGIGRTVVETFLAAGARAAFCDIDLARGAATARDTGAAFFHADIGDPASLLHAMSEAYAFYGDLSILINNAGISEFTPLVRTSVEQFEHLLAVNLVPVFVTAREMARRRDSDEGRRRYGRIVNIASTRALQSEPGSEGYAASKGGIVSLTHALALSLADYNITVNCISPGWIDTGHFGTIREQDRLQHPSGRVGTPADIARACLFLADPANDFINGQNLVIDGGMTKKMIYEQ